MILCFSKVRTAFSIFSEICSTALHQFSNSIVLLYTINRKQWMGFSGLAGFLWSVAELLRGDYNHTEY
jgi:hypothetical protein